MFCIDFEACRDAKIIIRKHFFVEKFCPGKYHSLMATQFKDNSEKVIGHLSLLKFQYCQDLAIFAHILLASIHFILFTKLKAITK